MADKDADVLTTVYRQVRAFKEDHREPSEIRLGEEDFCAVAKLSHPYTGPLSYDASRLFGVPLRRLPIRHAISVV